MYEVGLSEEVLAWHVMPGMPPPEGELHSHDYRIEVAASRAELDDRDMVCDLDVMEAALRSVVDRVRDKNLDEIKPPDAEAVTVEIFARWVHDRISESLHSAGVERLDVKVWESPIAYGAYGGPLS